MSVAAAGRSAAKLHSEMIALTTGSILRHIPFTDMEAFAGLLTLEIVPLLPL
jgi:hypothetical protein